MKFFQFYTKHQIALRRLNYYQQQQKPQHLICFKQWTAQMVLNIIYSAINLKRLINDTHCKRLDILAKAKVMILQEVNEPILNMAVSKAATLLGAYDTNIVDKLVWEKDYNGKIFSLMADAICVATSTHMCVQRFAEQSTVPVICIRSRTHASIQSLATVMAIIEEFGTMQNVTVSYIGNPHPVLNSYLLLCPMLGAHIRFKCCCNKQQGVSPLLYKSSQDLTSQTSTESKPCHCIDKLLNQTTVIIAGPSGDKKNAKKFKIKLSDIQTNTNLHWIFFHTCPRGEEVEEDLFSHCNARTFHSFYNMQYISAALLANAIKGYKF
ncbi:hypothetical protein ACJJTC_014107 [Scirpophaga incertulas]